jgi:hypothetical protein
VIFAPSHFSEFQMADKGMLLSRIIKNIVLAVSIIAVPTIILLGIIAGKFVEVQDGAVIVDVSLGVLLVFTSLAAVTAPFIYGTLNPKAGADLRSRQCVGCDFACSFVDFSLLPEF